MSNGCALARADVVGGIHIKGVGLDHGQTGSNPKGRFADYSLGTVERDAPVKVDVERQEGRYRGSARLRQSEFGITPVKVAGGAIKVKDEVRVDFEVVGR